MASKEKSTRFHPYDNTAKKPKIHRSNNQNVTNTTYKQPSNKNSTSDNKGLSINDLKRRIRDVKRLLTRSETLSPEARIVQERALKGYERDLEQEQARRQRSDMIRKYHFVRFLDRKTATKQLRAAQRQYEKAKQQQQDQAQLAALQKRIDIAQIDVNYTIYYPLTEKYLSLYPHKKRDDHAAEGHDDNPRRRRRDDGNDDNEQDTGDEEMHSSSEEDESQGERERPPMWEIIQKCMADKTLDKLREGKLKIGFDGKPLEDTATKKSGIATSTSTNTGKETGKTDREKEKSKSKSKSKKADVGFEKAKEGMDEDSDGGFFEE